jgi:hypothetical protein
MPDSPASCFVLIDITSPAPPAQGGIRPRARSGGEERSGEKPVRRALQSYALARTTERARFYAKRR